MSLAFVLPAADGAGALHAGRTGASNATCTQDNESGQVPWKREMPLVDGVRGRR